MRALADHGRLLLAHLDRAEHDVLEDGLVREEVERLEHHADLAAQPGQRLALGGQRLAVEDDRRRSRSARAG